jgi:hypothetical protein
MTSPTTLPDDLHATLVTQGAAPSHLPRLAKLRALCEQSSECLALALVGSFAQGKGDRLSDLDLAAFVIDGHESEFLKKAQAILDEEPVLHHYGMVYTGEVAFQKYVYLDASSCEFHAFNEHADFKLRQPFLAVWNPVGHLETIVVQEPPPRHEDFTPYPHGDDGLIWELYDCIKWLRRGRTGLAKDYLRKLVAALDSGSPKGGSGVV